MTETRQAWQQYKERLEYYGYTPEEIESVKEIRESADHCPDEQFKELVSQGIVTRTRKLKKKRNYYVNELGQFLYLDHYKRRFQYAGKFKEE